MYIYPRHINVYRTSVPLVHTFIISELYIRVVGIYEHIDICGMDDHISNGQSTLQVSLARPAKHNRLRDCDVHIPRMPKNVCIYIQTFCYMLMDEAPDRTPPQGSTRCGCELSVMREKSTKKLVYHVAIDLRLDVLLGQPGIHPHVLACLFARPLEMVQPRVND